MTQPYRTSGQACRHGFLGEFSGGKSQFQERNKDSVLSVVATVNQALDDLAHPTEPRRLEQHQMVAEAVALLYAQSYLHRVHKPPLEYTNESRDIDAQLLAQNIFCGAIITGNLALVESLLQDTSSATVDVNTESPYFGGHCSWRHTGDICILPAIFSIAGPTLVRARTRPKPWLTTSRS